ncbi:hypothetical protein TPHA_0C03120 [Tetrapisispora phaffii CBS 4417]|uniref:Myb-like domain-containing protein n=1 Tax=Tetrapisispora phaffii (strain ATCC 24235 / CBS 4417 / NBRC 1672 / NRRL Y-8282 / UCD 70-5) TaxID=1071381 RepID=G8BRT9_TETPH|nr:hypothetical protein TPHA_0C03120 [Tetrapisispora phaffii CBS 4417]CCE62465.1 hypothetical protein TPHA_0C03120 [Tetrapisispora phaffii CBS 4417]
MNSQNSELNNHNYYVQKSSQAPNNQSTLINILEHNQNRVPLNQYQPHYSNYNNVGSPAYSQNYNQQASPNIINRAPVNQMPMGIDNIRNRQNLYLVTNDSLNNQYVERNDNDKYMYSANPQNISHNYQRRISQEENSFGVHLLANQLPQNNIRYPSESTLPRTQSSNFKIIGFGKNLIKRKSNSIDYSSKLNISDNKINARQKRNKWKIEEDCALIEVLLENSNLLTFVEYYKPMKRFWVKISTLLKQEHSFERNSRQCNDRFKVLNSRASKLDYTKIESDTTKSENTIRLNNLQIRLRNTYGFSNGNIVLKNHKTLSQIDSGDSTQLQMNKEGNLHLDESDSHIRSYYKDPSNFLQPLRDTSKNNEKEVTAILTSNKQKITNMINDLISSQDAIFQMEKQNIDQLRLGVATSIKGVEQLVTLALNEICMYKDLTVKKMTDLENILSSIQSNFVNQNENSLKSKTKTKLKTKSKTKIKTKTKTKLVTKTKPSINKDTITSDEQKSVKKEYKCKPMSISKIVLNNEPESHKQ